MRDRPKPLEPLVDEERGWETHPAYGAIGVFNTTGRVALFGSRLESHDHYVTLRISRAEGTHDSGWQRHFPRETLCEVMLSPAQWAELISTPNMGAGTPCTLEYVNGEGCMPEIVNHKTEIRRTAEEIAVALKGLPAELRRARQELEAKLDKVPKKTRDAALETFDAATHTMLDKIPFLTTSVHENVEGAVASAKAEVEAYVSSAIRETGIAALKSGDHFVQIEEKKP